MMISRKENIFKNRIIKVLKMVNEERNTSKYFVSEDSIFQKFENDLTLYHLVNLDNINGIIFNRDSIVLIKDNGKKKILI